MIDPVSQKLEAASLVSSYKSGNDFRLLEETQTNSSEQKKESRWKCRENEQYQKLINYEEDIKLTAKQKHPFKHHLGAGAIVHDTRLKDWLHTTKEKQKYKRNTTESKNVQ